MAVSLSFDFNQFQKGFNKRAKEMQKDIETAQIRALNAVSKRALTGQVKEVAKILGITQKEVRRKITVKRASKRNSTVIWTFKGYRYSVSRPTSVIRKKKFKTIEAKRAQVGVRFYSNKRKRVTLTDRVKGGSKPFIIVGQDSGRKVAVYRKKGYKVKVSTITGHSRQHTVKHFSFPAAREEIRLNLNAEYKNQLKRSKYVKRR